jgi:hypothetical protein
VILGIGQSTTSADISKLYGTSSPSGLVAVRACPEVASSGFYLDVKYTYQP